MDEKLIEAIKKHEILYNRSSYFYRKKKKRAAAWSEISKEVDLPEDVCQARWRYLRDKYVKKVAEKNQRAPGSAAETIDSEWEYLNQMEFLREHIRSRKPVTNNKDEESLLNELLEENCSENVKSTSETLHSEMRFLYDPLSPSTSTSPPIEVASNNRKRTRRESNTEVFNEFVNKMTSIAETRNLCRTERDPHNGFFGMLREMFDKMDPEVVESAKFHFLNYLHEQRTKKRK